MNGIFCALFHQDTLRTRSCYSGTAIFCSYSQETIYISVLSFLSFLAIRVGQLRHYIGHTFVQFNIFKLLCIRRNEQYTIDTLNLEGKKCLGSISFLIFLILSFPSCCWIENRNIKFDHHVHLFYIYSISIRGQSSQSAR